MKVTIEEIEVRHGNYLDAFGGTSFWVAAHGEDKVGPFAMIRFVTNPTVWDLILGTAEMALDEAHLPSIPVDVD